MPFLTNWINAFHNITHPHPTTHMTSPIVQQIIRPHHATHMTSPVMPQTPLPTQTPTSTPYLTQYKALVKQRDDIKRQIAAVKKQPQSQQRAETLIALNRQLQSVIDQINALPKNISIQAQKQENAPKIAALQAQITRINRDITSNNSTKADLNKQLQILSDYYNRKIAIGLIQPQTGLFKIKAYALLPTDPNNPKRLIRYSTGNMSEFDKKAALGHLFWAITRPAVGAAIPQVKARIARYERANENLTNQLPSLKAQLKALKNPDAISQQNATSSQQLIANREKAMYNMRMKALQNKQNKQQVFIG